MLEKQMDNKQIRCMLKIIQGMTTVTIELQGLLRNHIHRESKKEIDTILLTTSLLNIDRFSQFFHRRTEFELCNKIIN